MKIPDDITPILREIDQSLKEQEIPPPERPFNAVKEFGNRFHISLPLTKLPPGAPAELAANGVYTERIHRWYEEVYGDRIKSDFSAKAKIAVLADGDIWEMRIPLIVGTVAVQAKRELPSQTGNVIGKRVLDVNPCASLTGITKARLRHFSDGDLKEIYGLFVVGLDVRNAFDRFRKADPLFAAAEDDWGYRSCPHDQSDAELGPGEMGIAPDDREIREGADHADWRCQLQTESRPDGVARHAQSLRA